MSSTLWRRGVVPMYPYLFDTVGALVSLSLHPLATPPPWVARASPRDEAPVSISARSPQCTTAPVNVGAGCPDMYTQRARLVGLVCGVQMYMHLCRSMYNTPLL